MADESQATAAPQGDAAPAPATEPVKTEPTATDPKAEPVKDEAAPKAEEVVVPEKYDLKYPEGVTPDEEIMTEFTALAKEAKLPNDKVQALYDLNVKAAQKALAKEAETLIAAAKTDKEFGGEKFDENLAIAKKALDLNPAFKQVLNQRNLGNHPEVIRFMLNIGKKLSEDTFVPGHNNAPELKSLEQRLYGTK
jgi:pyruvate/2-oxoglutarate dehydrogenase complex dihydrolipoamide acyltransferase (E2) component